MKIYGLENIGPIKILLRNFCKFLKILDFGPELSHKIFICSNLYVELLFFDALLNACLIMAGT